jgi:hypothetical protein
LGRNDEESSVDKGYSGHKFIEREGYVSTGADVEVLVKVGVALKSRK